ncbi:MAG: histidine--tRNA ligase [Bacteroidetes bacterium]|nr:MAG: histidine--tRNA ligase [Bacteroidota bacterium]
MKPSIPKGTRDFSPLEMVRRNFIFKTIREVFEKYGYQPIETPAMENMETLTGKYGDEGDRLIFRILNSGNFLNDFRQEQALKDIANPHNINESDTFAKLDFNNSEKYLSRISEKALRYDLTVPFARYVVQHQNEITFPFKRYQIQPVWRADRPQKGRYREFYQCDADVIGSDSLLNEVELAQIINDVYSKLGISVTIKINNRKILQGIAEYVGEPNKMIDIAIAIDKLDKVGIDGVIEELSIKGFSSEKSRLITEIVFQRYAQKSAIDFFGNMPSDIKEMYKENPLILKGFEELRYIVNSINKLESFDSKIQFDLSLARGLNYYTGAIFEVKANDVQIGSVCGGGRYDDLTGIFGLPNVSGVGISFGIDRIFDVMNELKLFEKLELPVSTTKVMLAHFGEDERNYCIGVASQLRAAGINTEIYPDVTKKIAKQFDYANKKQIPFVIVVGGDEMKTGELTLKNMATGEQTKMKTEEIVKKLQP